MEQVSPQGPDEETVRLHLRDVHVGNPTLSTSYRSTWEVELLKGPRGKTHCVSYERYNKDSFSNITKTGKSRKNLETSKVTSRQKKDTEGWINKDLLNFQI